MTLLNYIRDIAGLYIFWIGMHFICSHLYARYCAGNTWYMILLSPFVVPTPYCVGMRWVISKGAQVIDFMWIVIGKWILDTVVFRKMIPNEVNDDKH